MDIDMTDMDEEMKMALMMSMQENVPTKPEEKKNQKKRNQKKKNQKKKNRK